MKEPSTDDIQKVRCSFSLGHNSCNKSQKRFESTILRWNYWEDKKSLLSLHQFMCRTWTRNNFLKHLNILCISQNQTYILYINVKIKQTNLTRILAIVDTCAGLNFVPIDVLYSSSTDRIRYGLLPDIQHLDKKLLKFLGAISFAVQMAAYNVCSIFFFCKSLAALMTLEAHFCDMIVQTIRFSNDNIELENGTTLPVFCCGSMV